MSATPTIAPAAPERTAGIEMLRSLFALDGKVIIVTGGLGLLGRRYVRMIEALGGRAVTVDRPGSPEAAHGITLHADVTDAGSLARVRDALVARFGRVDALVNNAAIDPKFDADAAAAHTSRFEDYPLDAWRASIDVNLTGAYLAAQTFGSVMAEQTGGGVIVNVASTYGLVAPDQRLYDADDGTPAGIKPPDYAVTKAAAAQLTRYLAVYWAKRNVRVNTLTPGGVRNRQDDGFRRRYADRTPLGRLAEPDEMVGPLAFLLSPASSYMTGANLIVDGGWTAW